MDDKQRIVVIPQATATIISDMIIIHINAGKKSKVSSTTVDPIQLSIFGHRFMGVAEQMGRALQRLGNLRPGDVILSNSPLCGGTHLPGLTVITPILDEAGEKIIFWTASQGHHVDIGGILPGSMPSNSKELWGKNAVIKAFKIIKNGEFQEKELIDLLMAPAQFPGCQGTRCLQDNILNIKAQAAANHRGSQLINSLIADFGLDTVQLYMERVQHAAELAVRDMLKMIYKTTDGEPLQAIDYMDDETAIQLKVTIDPTTGGATFDFEGTGPEAYGNWNAPIAICNSAIIFALRCMVSLDIPLNQGAIRPITVLIPPTPSCAPLNPPLSAPVTYSPRNASSV
ncbi:hypothetical protein G7Y89_g15437 [Cudoniella acicularis]|uniref:Hydantoinase B/oxoprolinase domain-containing protein n=1 Tax=Cudoniella acicularis TaxID=354080 RepID=A0A8H4QNA5_9HELO|nr:hypothetical protein G7Y89_g15437 [Cudoniella acicularis]